MVLRTRGVFLGLVASPPEEPIPDSFSPWSMVYYYFRNWRDQGVGERAVHRLRARERVRQGRRPEPSAIIIDSQSVMMVEKGGLAATMREAREGQQASSLGGHPGLDPGRTGVARRYPDWDAAYSLLRQAQAVPELVLHLWLRPFFGCGLLLRFRHMLRKQT